MLHESMARQMNVIRLNARRRGAAIPLPAWMRILAFDLNFVAEASERGPQEAEEAVRLVNAGRRHKIIFRRSTNRSPRV